MKIAKVWFDHENIYIVTDSGHTIGNPLNWFGRLQKASKDQRENFEIGPTAESINWDDLDEDLSLECFSILTDNYITPKYSS